MSGAKNFYHSFGSTFQEIPNESEDDNQQRDAHDTEVFYEVFLDFRSIAERSICNRL